MSHRNLMNMRPISSIFQYYVPVSPGQFPLLLPAILEKKWRTVRTFLPNFLWFYNSIDRIPRVVFFKLGIITFLPYILYSFLQHSS